MDGECDHLCNRREAGDRAVIGGVFQVSTLVIQNRPPFEEPIVLLVPSVCYLPLDHLFHELEDCFLDRPTLLDGEGVDVVDSACLPWCGAPEDFIKLILRECKPSAVPSPDFISHDRGRF